MQKAFDYRSESGAAMSEYAIALSILIATFVVVNLLLLEGAKSKSKKVAITNTRMTPCDGDSDLISAEIANNALFDKTDACK